MSQSHSLTEGSVTTNGVAFHYLACGTTGPLALCLHGFPDSAWTWRHLLPELAAAGFRAIAPFMRGYAPSSIPEDGRFQGGVLSQDANELHRALGGTADAVIIGHDWGAAATYGAVNFEPDLWSRVVTMAVPPGGALMKAFTDPVQLQRSWYMFFFQHALSDALVPLNDLAFIDFLWSQWSPGYEAAEDLAHVKKCLTNPANLQAALGYYRAGLGTGYRDPELAPIQAAASLPVSQPALYLHGSQDGCIGVEVANGSQRSLVHPSSSVLIIEGAGHFLQLEKPREVNDAVIGFLRPD